MRALLVISALSVLLACGEEKQYTAECEALWPQAEGCWQEYCQLFDGNRLFCQQCLPLKQSLDGATCTCSGLARDSFLDACSAQEEPFFDCEADRERITALEEKWKCCLDSSDCDGGTCGEDHRCQ